MKVAIFASFLLAVAFAASSDPLQIVVLTESLCPACNDFVATSFLKAINTKDIEKIANITIVPFGNAKETQSGGHYIFTCQHGADECYGNAILNCVLNQKDKKTAHNAIVCLEKKRTAGSQWDAAVAACTQEQGTDLSQTIACANGPDGEKYVHQAAQNTDKDHKYVPWINVNGVHDAAAERQIRSDLVKYACDNYKGSVKIDACKTQHKSQPRTYAHTWDDLALDI